MQKKMWWCCGVSVAMAAIALNVAADYAARHPESFVGRCLIHVYAKNQALTQTLAQNVLESLQGTAGTAATQAGVSSIADPVPMPAASNHTDTPERLPGHIVVESDPPTIIEQMIEEECQNHSGAATPQTSEPAKQRMPYADEQEITLPARDGSMPNCQEDPDRDIYF